MDEPRPPDDAAREPDDEAENGELENPVPPVGVSEPLGVIELMREEVGARLARLFRRR